MTVRLGWPGHRKSDEVPRTLLGNVSVNEGDGQVFEFEEYLERDQMFRIYASSLRKMWFEGPEFQGKQKDYHGPAIVVQCVKVEGPIYESLPAASHERFLAGVPSEKIPSMKPNDDPNERLYFPASDKGQPRLTQLPKSKQNKASGNRNVYDPKQGVGGEPLYQRTRVKEPLHSTRQLVPTQDAVRAVTLRSIPRVWRWKISTS